MSTHRIVTPVSASLARIPCLATWQEEFKVQPYLAESAMWLSGYMHAVGITSKSQIDI